MKNISKPRERVMICYCIMLMIAIVVITLLSITVDAYTAPSYDSIDLNFTVAYTAPSYDSIDLVFDTVAEDTCTYSGSGTWNIDCSDNCNLVATDMGGENIVVNQSNPGQGNITFAGNVSNCGDVITAGYNTTDRCIIVYGIGGGFI